MSSSATTTTPQPASTDVDIRQQAQRRRTLGLIVRLVLIAISIAYALFPVFWLLSISLNPRNTIVVEGFIPENASLANYDLLLNSGLYPFMTWLWNSIKVSSITMVLTVLISTFSAYSFSRFRFRGRRTTLIVAFLVQVFPNSLSIVGTFLLVELVGRYIPSFGLNQHGGLILVYLGAALGINTWLIKGFFDSLPRDLDEAAMMDGATHWRTFWQILFPLMRPILAVVAILVFIATFNDYIIALTLLKESDVQTLAVGLNLFIGNDSADWGPFAAGALMGAVPVVILYMLMQDYIVGGLTVGAVKG